MNNMIGVTVKTKQVYVTSDNKEFDTELQAMKHENDLRKIIVYVLCQLNDNSILTILQIFEDKEEAERALKFIREKNISLQSTHMIQEHLLTEKKNKFSVSSFKDFGIALGNAKSSITLCENKTTERFRSPIDGELVDYATDATASKIL